MMPRSPAFKPLALAALLALSLGACARDPNAGDLGAVGPGGAAGLAGPGSVAEFNASIGDRVFFDSDSSELSPTAVATLDKQAVWLAKYGSYAFTLEGHADERGTREYNFALGQRRSETVKAYLVAKGVSVSRMKTISYGKERPVAVCDDISCWSQNRRSVTVLAGAPGS